jgi:hypothetical protein
MWRGSLIRQLVLWLVVILGCIANAQEQSQNPAPPDTSATPAGDGTRPPDSPGNSIRLGLSHAIEASQARDVGKGFGIIPPDFGAGHVYWDFSGSTTSGPVNPNAPWKVSARFTHAFDNGTIANVGVIGYRNYRIPPFMTQTIGSGQDLTLPLVSFADLSQPEMQWMLTAGIEKTFFHIPGGTTVGGVGDVFVPLNKIPRSLIVPDTQIPASITVRGGLKLGF